MFAIIYAQGLGRFYELGGGEQQPIGRVPAPTRRDWLEELEDSRAVGGRVRLQLDVQGIHCAACVWLIEQLWQRREGHLRLVINPSLGRADLEYDRTKLNLGEFLDAVEELGYRFAPPSKETNRALRGVLLRLGVCSAIAMNAMVFAFADYFGLGASDEATATLFGWLSFGLCTLALLVGGPVFLRAAVAGLRHRILHLDLPISVGLLLAYAGSVYQFLVIGGVENSYFDTVTIFITLMLAGRYIQERSIEQNRQYLLANDGAENLRARRLLGDRVVRVPIKDVVAGDILLLSPGDLLPANCVTLQGGLFSLDWIEGESAPRWFAEGEPVPVGAFLRGEAPTRVRAVDSCRESGLIELLATPAQDSRPIRPSRFWTLINRGYVAVVLLLALVGLLTWLVLDPSRAMDVTVAILVVTCPCALGIATPLAIDLALAGLRRSGVYVRNQSLFERARRVRKVVFDKTGTLTWGDTEAKALRPVSEDLRDILLTMAASSNHPVSQAIVAAESDRPFRFLVDLEIEEMIGRGLRASFAGSEYRLGSRSYVFGDSGRAGADELCIFARDGHAESCFQIVEDVRHGFRDELRVLRGAGMSVYVSSGDAPAKVARVAEHLDLPQECAMGGQRPEDKRAFVQKLDDADTLMVGDGLNDAPAFDVAWCSGAAALDRPAMPSRADFFFLGAGASSVSRVLATSHHLHRVIKTNLWLALIYNIGALTFAFAGWMTPVLCAVLMPASSIALIAHTAWRLRRVPSPQTEAVA